MTDTLPLSPETVRPAQEAGRIEPRTAVFRMRVGQAMTANPSAARTSDSLEAVVRMMDGADTSSVVLTDTDGRPTGIVTEQDIARRAAFRLPGNTPAADLMSHPVKSIDAGEYLYRAIAMMRRAGLRHMPVVDSLGVLVGMLDLHAALGFASRTLIEQIDSLTQDTDVDGNIRVKADRADAEKASCSPTRTTASSSTTIRTTSTAGSTAGSSTWPNAWSWTWTASACLCAGAT